MSAEVVKKKTPKRIRLMDKHPTFMKFQQVCNLMEDLGIRIEFYHGQCLLTDATMDSRIRFIRVEDCENPDSHMGEFPPTTEYVLVYDNPVYEAEEKERLAKDFAEREAKAAAEVKAREAKISAEKKQEAEQKEREERNLLAKLKRKYPDA